MIKNINNFISKMALWKILLLVFLFIFIVALFDYITGFEMSFSIFYLVPVSISSWYIKRSLSFFICIISAFTWMIIDVISGNMYSQTWIVVWNTAVRLGFFLIVSYLLSELKIHLNLEKILSQTDALTGLKNSRAFKDELNKILNISARYDPLIVAVGYIDLDNFKMVNDTMGHSEGDQVLMSVGSVLSQSIRGSDAVGRLGGDEFAVALLIKGISDTEIFFNRLHNKLVNTMKDRDWPIGFSVGVAIFPTAPPNEDQALKYADELMYKIKKSEKNKVIYKVVTDFTTNT